MLPNTFTEPCLILTSYLQEDLKSHNWFKVMTMLSEIFKYPDLPQGRFVINGATFSSFTSVCKLWRKIMPQILIFGALLLQIIRLQSKGVFIKDIGGIRSDGSIPGQIVKVIVFRIPGQFELVLSSSFIYNALVFMGGTNEHFSINIYGK